MVGGTNPNLVQFLIEELYLSLRDYQLDPFFILEHDPHVILLLLRRVLVIDIFVGLGAEDGGDIIMEISWSQFSGLAHLG